MANTREIKFRAWDKKYKYMNYKVLVGNTDHNDPNYTCNSIWVEQDKVDYKIEGSHWMNADECGIDLMQYTGLKDKNGKEIYEGDIVAISKTRNGEWLSWPVVYYFDGFKIKDRHLSPYKPSMYFWKMCEVIGNIYANANLIRK